MEKLKSRVLFAIMLFAYGALYAVDLAGNKVEELTLYIIELEKRITEVEKKGDER